MRRLLALALLSVALLAGAAGALAQLGGGSSDDQKGILAGLISRALSTPSTRVSIGNVQGALTSDATILDVEISDRDGVWLRLDRARIVWRRLALLGRRLEIDQLEVGTLDIRRRPIPAEGQVAGENDPILPDLPVKVEIKSFTLAELRLGEPLLGQAARVAASGQARLSNDTREGLELALDARRLDAPGTLALRLSLVPDGQRLTLSLKVDEPAGGIVARLADLPGQPPVKLDVDGRGTLDSFAARLALDGGPGLSAGGSGTLVRQGAARRLALDLQARVEALLPEVAREVFAGPTRLTGDVAFGDDGAVGISALSLAATAARLDVSGRIGPDGIADMAVTAANVPNRAGRTGAGGAELGRLAFDGHLTGPLSGPSVDATLAVEDARTASGRLARLDATLRAVAAGTAPGGATQLTVTADAKASGLVPADPALARAVGGSATLSLRGTTTTKAVVEVERLDLATPTLSARYAGRLGSDEIRGRLALEAASLRPFGGLFGLTLAGAAKIAADLEGTPRANRLNATLDGQIAGLATGTPAVDGLFGGRAALTGTVRVEPTGGYTAEALRLTSANATAEVNGRIAQEDGEVRITAALPDLRRLDARLSGRAALQGRVTGGLQHPAVSAEIGVRDATALGRAIPRLALTLALRDVTGAVSGEVKLDGTVDGKAARGGFRVAQPTPGSYRLDALDLAVGTVQAEGALALDADRLAQGRITVRAGNLDDLSPLLLTRASGTLDADVTLTAERGGQGARVKAGASNVGLYGFALAKADADLTVADLYRRPVISGTADVEEATYAGERISRLRLSARGNAQASDLTLSAVARGFDLDARARVVPGDRIRIELSQFTATRDRQRIALAGPASVTVLPEGAEIRNLAVALGNGRLGVNGTVGSRLVLDVEARAVPLSAADLVVANLGLGGTLDGSARITGTTSDPTGEYRARIEGLSAPQTRDGGLPRVDVAASGRLAAGRAGVEARITAGRAGTLQVTGSVPAWSAGALDLAVRGEVDVAAASSTLSAGGRRVSGRVAVDARVGGTLSAPEASGSARLAGGSFTDAGYGVQLANISATLAARGQEVSLEGGRASTRNGGTISASGRLRLDPDAGFPGEIRITGQNAELVRSTLATAVANLNLAISGPLARMPRVSGQVDLVSADIAVPDNFGGALKPLPNTRHRNPTPTAARRLAADSKAKGKAGRPSPPFDAALDLALTAPGRITVRGRGLNAELGGSLRLTGTLANPVPNGAFELRRGSLQIASARLDFTRGRLTFSGDLTPELDFAASTRRAGADLLIEVSGPADDPNFAFTSTPSLPPDEVLSRLLFDAPSGQLTAFQALALAQAAAQFSGSSGGGDAFEALRRSLGLSGLDLGLGPTGGITGGAQRLLGDRISVGVRGGASAADAGVGVDIRITDEIRIQGDVGATGKSSVGIGAQYEW